MGLINKEILIKITTEKSAKLYREKGYEINEIPCEIMIKSSDVNSSHTIRLTIQCDYCGEEYTMTSKAYQCHILHNDLDFACCKCGLLKKEKHMLQKYGVRSSAQLPDYKEKVRLASLKKYGVEHHTQAKEVQHKKKETMLQKYGVEHNFQLKECHEKAKETRIKKYGNYSKFGTNGCTGYSKAQKHICDLLNGHLNYPCHGFFLDCLYEDWLDIEYNGGGHDLKVKMGKQTREEFERLERRRIGAVKFYGYKQLIIEHKGRKLPDDDKLLSILHQAIFFLRNFEDKILLIDLDKKELTTFM